MSDTINERDAGAGSDAAAREDELARQEAIKRIEHKRYWTGTAVSTGGMRADGRTPKVRPSCV